MSDKVISNDALLATLRRRYATKKFDPQRKISEADWKTLEEALVLTPSSFGLQPWKFIIVSDPNVRSQLVPVTWNQTQVTECSHYVVFAIIKNLSESHVDAYLNRISHVRGIPVENLQWYREMMVDNIIQGPRSLDVNNWAARQAYIALGNFMTSAALLGIDTCPIEGLEPGQYDKILGLSKRGLATVMACAAGYRNSEDKYATLAKVRFDPQNVIERI